MNNFVDEIYKRLSEVEAKKNLIAALKGFFVFVSTVSLFVLIVCLAEYIAPFGTTVRGVLFYFSIVAAVFFLIRLVVVPLLQSSFIFSQPDYFHAAGEVGGKYPDIKDDLLNSLQLLSENAINFSTQLVNAAFERVYKKTKSYNFQEVVNYSSARKHLRNASIVFGSVFLLFVFVPGLGLSGYRIMNYNTSFTPPPKFVFEVSPGNTDITKGDDIKITVAVKGNKPSQITLFTKSGEQAEYEAKYLVPDSLGNYNFIGTAVKSSFNYFAFAEGIESSVYTITVVNRPFITNYELTVVPPAYSKLPNVIQRDNGNITALPGSWVKMKLNSSRELSKATISFSDSTEKPMTVNDEAASVDFNISKEINYKMLIVDNESVGNINPISYSIKLLTDDPPSIEVVSPDQNIKLGSETKISLVSKIKDDYGFSKMNLNYRLSASKYRQITDDYSQTSIPINKDLKEEEVYYVWDLAPLVLAEGEVMSYYVEIFDNDIINGPKSAKSPVMTISVPSLDDLFASADNTQQEATNDLAQTLDEAQKLQLEMQKISDDLKQNNREISWQEKERIENAADKFKELTSKVDDISKKLSDMKKDLMHNNLFSEETMQKYNELQKLLDEMTNDEMKEAFKRLQESLKSLMRNNAQMSLDEMKANEEYFKKSLERTVNLLKRIQVEQKIDELVKRTEDLSNKLDELKEKTNQSDFSDKDKQNELEEKQSDISQEMKRLDEEMNKLDNKMSELTDMPKDKLENAMQEFDKQQNAELSEETLKELQKMQKMQAMKNQQQLSQNMKMMNKQFQDLQSAMQQMNQVKSFYGMMKVLDDLITLSKEQEKLKNNTEQINNNTEELQKNSREQYELQDNLDKVLQNMSSLSQKTFAITPEMGKELGDAFSNMQQSITSMQNQNGSMASQFQKQAMQHLNQAASLMKGSMDQMMNGGQGGGMMSLMQQMQSLAQQQMNLNQLTRMLNRGQITQEMAAQMQRLAQQQEYIRKSLQQMNKEARESGQSKRLAANLQKILDDMKEVVTNLHTEKINDDLIKKQEKILSRMLDAQLSVNERDYEKERQSNSGQNVVRNSPPDLALSTEEGRDKIKDELLKAVREGYKKDYEDLIRKYFEALENNKK